MLLLEVQELPQNDNSLRFVTMDDALFVEYWDEAAPPERRIKRRLEKTDALTRDWMPSKKLFLNYSAK
ncbi:MAG: hypothetical protein LBJ35_06095 [Spirochaetaceae bacterium]|nr:hypothetical protein [Spirochaetaceae bacterium]